MYSKRLTMLAFLACLEIISLWTDCLYKICNLHYISLAFIASSFRGTEYNLLFETGLSGPPSFFRMFSLFIKNLIFIFLFTVTAADVVPCGGLKKQPRKSSIVQLIFYFRSFEISGTILKIRTTL